MDEYYKSVVNISDLFDRAFEGSAAIVGNPVASKTKYIIYCTGLKKKTLTINNQFLKRAKETGSRPKKIKNTQHPIVFF